MTNYAYPPIYIRRSDPNACYDAGQHQSFWCWYWAKSSRLVLTTPNNGLSWPPSKFPNYSPTGTIFPRPVNYSNGKHGRTKPNTQMVKMPKQAQCALWLRVANWCVRPFPPLTHTILSETMESESPKHWKRLDRTQHYWSYAYTRLRARMR